MAEKNKNDGAGLTDSVESVEEAIDEIFPGMYTLDDFKNKFKSFKKYRDLSEREPENKEYKREYEKAEYEFFTMFEHYNRFLEKKDRVSYKNAIGKALTNAEYEKILRYDMKLAKNFDELEDRLLGVIRKKYKIYPAPGERMKELLENIKPEMPQDLYEKYKASSERLKILMILINAGGLSYTEELEVESNLKKTNISTGEVTVEEKNYTETKTRYIVTGICHIIGKYASEKPKKNEITRQTILEILKALDDNLFAELETRNKDFAKPTGAGELLRMANDLANGTFGEYTKKYMYLFALAAGLKYHSKDPKDIKLDIEKQLFEKYYIDMPQVTAKGPKQAAPSGQHINYNNFAELAYLHFIQKPGYDPETLKEKIRQSDLMIRRLILRAEKQGPAGSCGQTYTNMINALALLNIEDDEDFENELFKKFNCQGRKFKDIGAHQNTAYGIYNKYREKLFENWGIDKAVREKLFENRGIDKADKAEVDAVLKNRACGLCFTKDNALRVDDFGELLKQTDKMLGENCLLIERSENMSRTALIAVYYYYYISVMIEKCGDLENEEEEFMDFYTFYYDLIGGRTEKGLDGLNSVLSDAFYDDFSTYNLFDMIVLCSLYLSYFRKFNDKKMHQDAKSD